MKKIKLTQGKYALVDDEDFDEISKYKWCAKKDNKNGNWYAEHRIAKIEGGNNCGYHIKLHRFIMKLKRADGKEVDHINGNGLDCSKENLRVCTHAQNMANQHRKAPRKTAGIFRGVHPHKERWRSDIRKNGKRHHLGVFDTQEEAAIYYNTAAQLFHGEFAILNPI